jgi:cytochrome bd-type quinol oxidase subunit 2
MGSTVSIALGLLMTGAVFLLLHTDSRLADESRPLMVTTLGSVLLAAIAAASFYAELKQTRWRHLAHAGLVALLVLAVWTYWPKD